jgi:TetR/AcrR family transcriptional regulator, transcriptional repressor for nem operon
MGRKRLFDYHDALQRATNLFWAKGYSNTSLRELLKTMGIGEGSFYNLMKGKKRCYFECLKYYNETVYGRRWEAFSQEPTVQKGIRKFFKTILDDLDDPKIPNICLMAGSLSPEILSYSDLGQYVLDEMRRMEKSLEERLRGAVVKGEIPSSFNCQITAQLVVTFLQGFFRVVRLLKSRPEMERQVEAFLSSLGL